nr:hypothetical protein [Salipiger mangrovisoli]
MLRIERDRGFAVAPGFFPIPGVNRELGELPSHIDEIRILLDETKVLAIGLLGPAVFEQQSGIEPARLEMHPIVVEDVAQLEHCALGVTLLKQQKRGLEKALPSLFTAFAARYEGYSEK